MLLILLLYLHILEVTCDPLTFSGVFSVPDLGHNLDEKLLECMGLCTRMDGCDGMELDEVGQCVAKDKCTWHQFNAPKSMKASRLNLKPYYPEYKSCSEIAMFKFCSLL